MSILWPELILDLKECDTSRFTTSYLQNFCLELCKIIDMEPVYGQFYAWVAENDPDDPKLHGVSCVQFIKTSSITIHTMTNYRSMTLNIHSCQYFSEEKAEEFALEYFGAKLAQHERILHKVSDSGTNAGTILKS